MPGWLSFIDIAVVLVVVFFAWSGLQKGFAGQVAHFLTVLIFGGLFYFGYRPLFIVMARLFRGIDDAYIMWLLAVGLLVLAFVIFILISKLLAQLLKANMSDVTDRVCGLLLGAGRGFLMVLLGLALTLLLAPLSVQDTICGESRFGRFVTLKVVPRIRPRVDPVIWKKNKNRVEQRIQEERERLQYEFNEGES